MEYKYDLHIHTNQSSMCGGVDAQDIVRDYRAAGYSGLMVSDHYFDYGFACMKQKRWADKIDHLLEGYRCARKEAEGTDFHVLLGIELRFIGSMDDFLIIGIDEQFLLEHENLYELKPHTFRELIRGKDMLMCQAHPYRMGEIPSPEYLDAVEVYNGKDTAALNARSRAFANEHHLMQLSGSDFHYPMDLARGGIILHRPVDSAAELVTALREQAPGIIRTPERD